MEFFFANHFKNWLLLGTAYRKFPRMAAELALSGVKQRRQNVRVNFPYAVLRNSAIFSQVCEKELHWALRRPSAYRPA